MKRLTVIIFLLCVSSVFATQSNLNGDCIVNFADFAILANDWQKTDPNISDPNCDFDDSNTVDVNDLATFADEWLTWDTLDRTPVVEDESFYVYIGASYTFNISATDSQSMTYSIETLPAHGTIYDSNTAEVNSVPWNLSDNEVKYTADANYTGSDKFKYAADDGTGLTPPCGGKRYADASITINALPIPPTANDVNTWAYVNVTQIIELDASDDGHPSSPGKLKYIITSLPSDANLQDPASGAGIVDPCQLPYTLSSWGDEVWFSADSNTVRSFQYKANDSGVDANSGDSNTATVTITMYDHPKDYLTFDGYGQVEFADQNNYDIVDGWAIDFWVNTRKPFAGLLKKRDATGGYEIGIVSGKPKIYFYDSNGLVASARSYYRVDDGQWREVEFVFNYDANGGDVYISIDGSGEAFNDMAGGSSFANDANLIVGLRTSTIYQDQLDKIRFFSGVDDPTGLGGIIQGLSGRTESGSEVLIGIGKASDVLFMLDEGTGTTVTDSKLSYTGTLNDPNHVLWLPLIRPFSDTSVQQYHRGR